MEISAKEYLGNRNLHFFDVSGDIIKIGEWAFANCRNLKKVTLPSTCKVASNAFEGCDNLSEIKIIEDDKVVNRYPRLLALSVIAFKNEAGRLIDVAAKDKDFIYLFEEMLLNYLNESDDAGFVPFLAGGEEDYEDEEKEKSDFLFKRRSFKIRLIYELLVIKCDRGSDTRSLSDDRLMEYVKRHNPEISFCVVNDLFDEEPKYANIYFKYGLHENIDPMILLKMAEGNNELRAIVLKETDLNRKSSAWDSFSI